MRSRATSTASTATSTRPSSRTTRAPPRTSRTSCASQARLPTRSPARTASRRRAACSPGTVAFLAAGRHGLRRRRDRTAVDRRRRAQPDRRRGGQGTDRSGRDRGRQGARRRRTTSPSARRQRSSPSRGPQQVTIVGITKFGSSDAIDGGGTVSISKANAFDWLSRGQVEYQDLYVRGSGDQQALAAAIEPCVPDGFKVQDGDELPRGQAQRDRCAGRVPQEGAAGVRAARDARRRVRDLQHLQRDRQPAPARAGGSVRDRGDPEADQARRCGTRAS